MTKGARARMRSRRWKRTPKLSRRWASSQLARLDCPEPARILHRLQPRRRARPYKVFGYPRDLAVGHLQGVYERGDIANRIIKAFPAATWRDTPVVKDDAGDSAEKLDSDGNANENYSPFVDEFWKLAKAKRLFSIIERADRLASIGRFGIIVMGFKDGSLSLSEPMAKGKSAAPVPPALLGGEHHHYAVGHGPAKRALLASLSCTLSATSLQTAPPPVRARG